MPADNQPTFAPKIIQGENILGRNFRHKLDNISRFGERTVVPSTGSGAINLGQFGIATAGGYHSTPPVWSPLLLKIKDGESWEKREWEGIEDDVDSAVCLPIYWHGISGAGGVNSYAQVERESAEVVVYDPTGANPTDRFYAVINIQSGRLEVLSGAGAETVLIDGPVIDAGCDEEDYAGNPIEDPFRKWIVIEYDGVSPPCANVPFDAFSEAHGLDPDGRQRKVYDSIKRCILTGTTEQHKSISRGHASYKSIIEDDGDCPEEKIHFGLIDICPWQDCQDVQQSI